MIERLFEEQKGIPPRPISANEPDIPREQLRPGVRIARYTEVVSRRKQGYGTRALLLIEVPCCGRTAELEDFCNNSIHLILCVCGVAYGAEIFDENDGGYQALLEVEEIEYVRTRKRPLRDG